MVCEIKKTAKINFSEVSKVKHATLLQIMPVGIFDFSNENLRLNFSAYAKKSAASRCYFFN